MHSLYRDLLALRHERDVLRRGDIEFTETDGNAIRFERRLDRERIVVLVSVADAAVGWPADLADTTVLLSSDPDRQVAGGDLTPNEAVVLRV